MIPLVAQVWAEHAQPQPPLVRFGAHPPPPAERPQREAASGSAKDGGALHCNQRRGRAAARARHAGTGDGGWGGHEQCYNIVETPAQKFEKSTP